MSSHAVASALGHTSPAVTHAHYIQAGTKHRVSTRRIAAKLGETSGQETASGARIGGNQ